MSNTAPDPSVMRRSYQRAELDELGLSQGWLALFQRWFGDVAHDERVIEPNAMQVATVSAAGVPSVRTLLMKGIDEAGLTFFTNYSSAKGEDLAANPQAAVVFAWLAQERQVRLSGPVTKVSEAESAAYFHSRPRGSQLGAWASPQSQVVTSREQLVEAQAYAAQRYPSEVALPPHWGGYRLTPTVVEFWQGRPDRLHDRLRVRLSEGTWVSERLAP